MLTTKKDDLAESLRLALIGLDAQIADLRDARAQLAALIDQPSAGSPVKVEAPRKRRKLSAAARAKISAAAKARWAREKKAKVKTRKPKTAAKKAQSKAKPAKAKPAPAEAKKSTEKKGKSKSPASATEA